MSVQFKDFSIKVKDALESTAIAFLEAAAGEIETQVQRNLDTAGAVDSGQLKGSFKHITDESKLEVTVGSPLENALWTELGTGEYALKGNGRKGGWYVPADKLSPKAKSRMPKITLKNGQELYFTKGKKPVRMLQKAFDGKKAAIKRLAERMFKEGLG